jgi:S1-C subfamily serine protease
LKPAEHAPPFGLISHFFALRLSNMKSHSWSLLAWVSCLSGIHAGCGQDGSQSQLEDYSREDLADSYEDPVLANFDNVARPDLVEKIARLRISANGRTGRCSATVVSPTGLILTAAHCVDDDPDEIMVTLASTNRTIRANIVKIWSTFTIDAAFLQLETSPRDLSHATIADHLPKVGETIYSVNYPFGQLNQSQGTVLAVESSGSSGWLTTTAFVGPGSSGGAFFDQSGQLVGLTNSQDENPATGKVNVGTGDAAYSKIYETWEHMVRSQPE